MLSIQIDTQNLKLVIRHQFNNIKLSFFASQMKSSFSLCTFNRCCTVIRYSRVMYYHFPGYNSSLAACKTTRSKKSCKFPFLYRGVSQHSCLMLDPSQPSGFWCSVANFPNGTVRAWDTCNNQCPTSLLNQGKRLLQCLKIPQNSHKK